MKKPKYIYSKQSKKFKQKQSINKDFIVNYKFLYSYWLKQTLSK